MPVAKTYAKYPVEGDIFKESEEIRARRESPDGCDRADFKTGDCR